MCARARDAPSLCCQCGVPIAPNPANMCVDCIRTQVDITEGIPKQATLHWCKFCERYLQPPGQWLTCQLESRELLSLCLKKLKGLSKVRLVDASFVWTEPHSKRIKVKLVIQKEVCRAGPSAVGTLACPALLGGGNPADRRCRTPARPPPPALHIR